nr:hypothetical protein [uncultured bacterium]
MDPPPFGGGVDCVRCDELQHFFYLVDGEVSLKVDGVEDILESGGFAYVSAGCTLLLRNR